jgi:tungstate transport system permease protein
MDYLLEGLQTALLLLFSGQPETWSAVWATVKVTLLSMSASLVLGVPLGFVLGYAEFPGRRALRLVSDTFLALPTVLIGLLVYAFLCRRGPFGEWGLLFTLSGIAIGQAILALPIVVSLTAQAVESQDVRLRQTLLTLGAGGGRLALGCLHEARFAVILAGLNAFGRVVTEVGISMMVGGNIKWDTRTITTAITLETGKGEFAVGIALGLILLLMAFVVNTGLAVVKRKAGAR